MKPYNQHSHVPVWMSALNGNMLTRTELDILDFVWFCKKYGCRTSNDRIGLFTHHPHSGVQRAVHKIYSLNLVAITNYGKRTRTIKPVAWPDQATWLKYQKMAARPVVDAAHSAPHISSLDKTTPRKESSRLEDSESTFQVDDVLPRGETPQTPPHGSVGKVDIPFTPKEEIPIPTYQEAATQQRNILIEKGWSKKQAERMTRKRYSEAKFED